MNTATADTVRHRHRQHGTSLIAVIFIMTALAGLGASMTRMIVLSSADTIDEWYSSQAFYAAESGIERAIWDITRQTGAGNASNQAVGEQSWVDIQISQTTVGGQVLYHISSTGKAGGSSDQPRAQRRILVEFMP